MKKTFFTFITLLAFGALLFTSCERVELPNEIAGTQEQFHTTLRMNMDNVGDIPIGGGNRSGLLQATSMQAGEFQTIYLDIQNITPDVQKRIDNVSTLRDISQLVVDYGALVETSNENANLDIQFFVPVREAQRSLDPMVAEAKNYLQSRGFTSNEIQEMVARENATVYDLIPLVIFLQESAFVDNPFANCARVATGVELTAATRVSSRTAIEQVFEQSVSLNYGAVMSAIAVGNYRHCLVTEMDVIVYDMLTSDEFEKVLDKVQSLATMFLFERFEGTQRYTDLKNVETREELMTWISHNKGYTLFTSVEQAGQLFEAVEDQAIEASREVLTQRMEYELDLLDDRLQYWAETNWWRGGGGDAIDRFCRGVAEASVVIGVISMFMGPPGLGVTALLLASSAACLIHN